MIYFMIIHWGQIHTEGSFSRKTLHTNYSDILHIPKLARDLPYRIAHTAEGFKPKHATPPPHARALLSNSKPFISQ
jgi:hypothetical protein